MSLETLSGTIDVGLTLTNIFTFNGYLPGRYAIAGELFAVPAGAPSVSITAAFAGNNVTNVSLILGRFAANGTPTYGAFSVFGTSPGSTWVWAKINGVFTVTQPGAFQLGCTRTGGTNHTILAASYLDVFPII